MVEISSFVGVASTTPFKAAGSTTSCLEQMESSIIVSIPLPLQPEATVP